MLHFKETLQLLKAIILLKAELTNSSSLNIFKWYDLWFLNYHFLIDFQLIVEHQQM